MSIRRTSTIVAMIDLQERTAAVRYRCLPAALALQAMPALASGREGEAMVGAIQLIVNVDLVPLERTPGSDNVIETWRQRWNEFLIVDSLPTLKHKR
ncbi:MAG: hypothetical protein ACREA9_10215 [Pyrinomonadaceae bacterium]